MHGRSLAVAHSLLVNFASTSVDVDNSISPSLDHVPSTHPCTREVRSTLIHPVADGVKDP